MKRGTRRAARRPATRVARERRFGRYSRRRRPLNACFGIFLADDDEGLGVARGAQSRTCSRTVPERRRGRDGTRRDVADHGRLLDTTPRKKGRRKNTGETSKRLWMRHKQRDDDSDIMDDDADEKAKTRSSGAGGAVKIAWQYRRYLEQNKRESAEKRSGVCQY